MMSRKHDKFLTFQAGFTAIELILVIIVIGILGALAVRPLLYSPDTMKLDAEAQRLLTDVRYVQALSMFRNERYRLNFSNSGSYGILTSSGAAFNYFAAGGTSVTLETGTTLSTNGNNYLVFDGRGIPYLSSSSNGSGSALGSTYTITLTNSSGTETVSVTGGTGEASMS
ncbi:MAG: prepilin-type N-terminal cleavage/methylation domain-containing protein [Coxiellaceae bacterium]|nr:prepilin-type N-terminal cleavage/methylation domain-containing protein [Coxiellaceae bacterium]